MHWILLGFFFQICVELSQIVVTMSQHLNVNYHQKPRSEQMFRLMEQLVQNNTHGDDEKGIFVGKIVFCDEQRSTQYVKILNSDFRAKSVMYIYHSLKQILKVKLALIFFQFHCRKKWNKNPNVSVSETCRLKCESLNGCYWITKHAIFPKNEHFLPPKNMQI